MGYSPHSHKESDTTEGLAQHRTVSRVVRQHISAV